ncbi:MAG: phosphoenolpyruvate hydrolase family protein [Verrucomicrobia bacterium]|nr:phosphoenolpyruvate hydrolase family protein [Verrucomicrobiota bacterium]
MVRHERSKLIERFQQMKRDRIPIIGGGAGIGISAKGEEAGGIDLIVIYNSGRYRMAGRGSAAGLLAYGNANEVVLEMAMEILPVVQRTPVLAGVNGTDPFCDFDSFLDQLKRIGFAGIQNFPTVGVIDGNFRKTLEDTGMGYELEVELIKLAHQKELLTTPYIFSERDAVAMAEAGADLLVAHFGTTVGGAIGATAATPLTTCAGLLDRWAEAALSVRKDIIVIGHGGPLANPEDAAALFKQSRHCAGFYGASSMERLPVETALANRTKEFKALRF